MFLVKVAHVRLLTLGADAGHCDVADGSVAAGGERHRLSSACLPVSNAVTSYRLWTCSPQG